MESIVRRRSAKPRLRAGCGAAIAGATGLENVYYIDGINVTDRTAGTNGADLNTEIIQEQIWFMDDLAQTRLQETMDIPRDSGWRIRIEGDVDLVVDIAVAPDGPQGERTAQGLSTTGFHCVNAIPPLCEAPEPGIKTFLDLPMIAGRMGTHQTPR